MRFSKSAPAKVAPLVLTGPAKLAKVTHLMDKLNLDLQEICMLPHQRDAVLEQLKIYGRDPKDADPIFAKEGTWETHPVVHNNADADPARGSKYSLVMPSTARPSQLLEMRCAAWRTQCCSTLPPEPADNINHNIARHAKQYDEVQKIEKKESDRSSNSSVKEKEKSKDKAKRNSKVDSSEPGPMEDMSLIETLKLLFNMTHFCPERSRAFSPAIPYILRLILKRHVLPGQPMEPPMSQLVNSLINLELEPNASAFFPRSDPKTYVERMIVLLDLATAAYSERDLEQQVSPILSLMRKVYNLAPRPVKIHMRVLLPTADDRAQPLGKTDTLSSRILRLSTSPVAPTAREELSSLLFEMSDKDAKNFVQNVGYGFSSRFILRNDEQNVPSPLPKNLSDLN
ncbi:hypothetical protein V500_01166 [Pseudogymnoascus sp. VKM F-4518 (FW-2643)]|nr:hypothetical protein V500_01166 [Pseudogymnoascus sp. VKM F-4518 (FW-2643)]